jgi:hypothetical protein
MSAISGSTSLQSLFANLQKATASAAAPQTASTSSTASTNAATTSSTGSTPRVQGHHHRHKGGGGGLRSQIETAVETALSNATPGSDVDQTIQTAIQNVLKKNQSSSASSTDANGTSPKGTTSTTGNASFENFLESNGVSAQEFAKDLKAAFQTAYSSGQTPDTSAIFSQLPAGSEVDVNA